MKTRAFFFFAAYILLSTIASGYIPAEYYWEEQKRQQSDIEILDISDGCAHWSYYISNGKYSLSQREWLRDALVNLIQNDSKYFVFTNSLSPARELIDLKNTPNILENDAFIKWTGKSILAAMKNDKITVSHSEHALPTRSVAIDRLLKKYSIYLVFPYQDTSGCY